MWEEGWKISQQAPSPAGDCGRRGDEGEGMWLIARSTALRSAAAATAAAALASDSTTVSTRPAPEVFSSPVKTSGEITAFDHAGLSESEWMHRAVEESG